MRPQDEPTWVPRTGEACRRAFASAQVRRNRTEGAEDDNRTTITINTAQEDRHGTIIEPEGARLEGYNQNPVVLINHRYDMLAGTSTVSLRNSALVANMLDEQWDLDDPEIERWYRKMKGGTLSAASIGFRANEVEKELIDEDGDPYDASNIRYRITDWELLEWSWVTVPSNPGAVVTQRQMAAQDPTMIALRGLEEKVDRLLVDPEPTGNEPNDESTDNESTNDQSRDANAAATDADDEAASEGEEKSRNEPDEAASDSEEDAPEAAAQGEEPDADADEADDAERLYVVDKRALRELLDEAERTCQRNALTLAKRRLGKA